MNAEAAVPKTLETVTVKVQSLDAERFLPYGQVLQRRQPLFPEVEPGEGRPAMELVSVRRPLKKQALRHMAIHHSYNQTFIPLDGEMVLVVAPAPPRAGDPSRYPIDYAALAAFLIRPGDCVMIDKGVWHVLATVEDKECAFINTTRKDPGEGTTVQGSRGAIGRGYIETTIIAERDGKAIAIEL